MITIQPQYLNLWKLLGGRLFRIPEYQRAYSWSSHEREDLFGDIQKVAEKGDEASHFMATVVCLRNTKKMLGTDEYQETDVVDGQQRLTTLIILLKSIAIQLDQKNKSEKKLADEISQLLVKEEGDELLLLQTNHDSSHHFATFLRKGTANNSESASTLADREILMAIEECRAFVEGWKRDGHTLPCLMTILKNKLFFLLHEIADEGTVYSVFEVLNSRGLEVAWLDRLKSMLMGAAFELKNAGGDTLINDLHTIWRDIYSVIGLRQGLSTEALRFTATLLSESAPSRPLGAKDAVDFLRSSAKNAKQIREVANQILLVTRAYDKVAANPRINAVTQISQARLLATAILLRDDLKKTDRDALMARWEKVSFRIYGMLGKDARTGVGDYVRLAWNIRNKKMAADAIRKEIGEIGSKFPIRDAIDSLRNANCYEGWEEELRYFMFRYEEHLAEKNGVKYSNANWAKIWTSTPTQSIEHILAQSKTPEKYRHCLGNLVLLPPKLNSKFRDISPKDKAEEYQKTGLLIDEEVAQTIKTDGWQKKTISEREDLLLQWAATEWAD